MRKKILVPVMALAMIVTAGVNYGMISDAVSVTGLDLSMLVKTAFAKPEGTVCSNCGCEFCDGTNCQPPSQEESSDTTDDNDGWETDKTTQERVCGASGGGCN